MSFLGTLEIAGMPLAEFAVGGFRCQGRELAGLSKEQAVMSDKGLVRYGGQGSSI